MSTSSSDDGSEENIENVSSLVLDLSLEKEKSSFTPIDIEVQILNERLKALLDHLISKVEIVILLNNTREFDIKPLLEGVIPPEELDVILDEEFYVVNFDYLTKDYTIITKDMIRETIENPECFAVPSLTAVFDVFIKYPVSKAIVKYKVQEMYENIKQKMAIPPDTFTFLRAMYRLKAKIEERLTMTAMEKLRKEVMQRNLKKTNQMFKDKIDELNMKLESEWNAFNGVFVEKDVVKKNYQAELDLLKSECVTIINKKIVCSERQMMKDTAQHKIDYESLVVDEAKITQDYDDLLKAHLGDEDILRGKRFKIETTLTSWLQKYDKEVGDRQNELDNLTQMFEDERDALADLKKRFDAQEELYTPLITMKRTEEETNFALRYKEFRTNYAAKKIQRWIRAILRKSKKGKKGKKKKR